MKTMELIKNKIQNVRGSDSNKRYSSKLLEGPPLLTVTKCPIDQLSNGAFCQFSSCMIFVMNYVAWWRES